ncbi:MAG: hypothetical protein EA377_02350 [Phycisphaerales bacterium]|nr:MAG: hypothetical protein EA377_02350 [Phycisphaerales bacterium]
MFKFLRKYNKWILAVGGTLLMIVFLIPQAIEGLAHSAGAERATRATIGEDNTRIRNAVWSEVNREMDFIRRRERFEPFFPELGRIENVGHWYLLSLEAERAGLVPASGSIGISREEIEAAAAGTGLSPRIIERTFAKLFGVERLIESYLTAGESSDRRVRHFASRILHEVDTEYFVINASSEGVDFEPSDQQLREQLERYGKVDPGEGDHGFGYRLPHRVKLEWITISADAIREMLLDSEDMSRVEQRIHWKRNPDGNLPQFVEGATEVPEEVRQDLLARLMERRVEEIARYARDQLRASQRGLSQVDGYYVLPDDWSEQQLEFPELAERVRTRFDIELPAYRAIGDRWLTLDELDELNGIADGETTRFGSEPLGLRELVQSARQLDGSAMVQIQRDIAGPPLVDLEQNIYLFRITDVDPRRAPQNVDEVREQLVRDLRRLEHFRRLSEQTSEMEQRLRDRGLLDAAIRHGEEIRRARLSICDLNEVQMRLMTQQPLKLVPTNIPGLGPIRPTLEAVVDQARHLDALERRGETVRDEDRRFVLPVEDRLAVMVGRIRDQSPLSRDEYELYAQFGLFTELIRAEESGGEADLAEAFGYDALAARHQFRILRDDDEIDPAELEEIDLDELASAE